MVRKDFENPGIEYRPQVRWWLAEGMHTDETLKSEIEWLKENGFGGIEFLAMPESGIDSKTYGWGSKQWNRCVDTIFDYASKQNMEVSTTSGTNWANTNLPDITPDDDAASKELDFISMRLEPGETYIGGIPLCEISNDNIKEQPLVGVTEARVIDEYDGKVILDLNSMREIPVNISDRDSATIEYTAPADGVYEIFFFRMHGTGQTADPSVGTNYTINYMDHEGSEALIKYWNENVLNETVKTAIRNNRNAMLYMDSLELDTCGQGGLFWGKCVRNIFKSRRGYDVLPYLPLLMKYRRLEGIDMMPANYRYDIEDHDISDKIRNDMYQTLTELYMESTLMPLKKWANSVGMGLRAEISYGVPFEISLPGKCVDGVETESLEFASQIDSYRGLAGTAHMYDRMFSAETGANLYNYMLGINFYTQIIYTQFAAGVTKTMLHGYASKYGCEADTCWPGHEGMLAIFAERFGMRQPTSVHYPDWTKMISRFQMILRKGKPRIDVAILRLDYFFNNMFMQYGPEKETYETKFMRANEGIYWKDMSLQNNGYTYEYFAPQILCEDEVDYKNGMLCPQHAGYKALIIYQEQMPVKCAYKLLELAQKGLPIVIVDGVCETVHINRDKTHIRAACKTPFWDKKDDELIECIKLLEQYKNVKRVPASCSIKDVLESMDVYPRTAYAKENSKVLTTYRETDKEDYIYLYNYMYKDTEKTLLTIRNNINGKVTRMDCWTGDITEVTVSNTESGKQEFTVELMPGEAVIIAVSKNELSSITNNIVMKTEAKKKMQLTNWTLEVFDWNPGKKVKRYQKYMGTDITECAYETSIITKRATNIDLVPWKDIAGIGKDVSGVGKYRAEIYVDENVHNYQHAILRLASISNCTVAVYVNGKKAKGFDINRLQLDIISLIKTGANSICIEVATTLMNKLLATNFYKEQVFEKYNIPYVEDVAFGCLNDKGDGDNAQFPMPFYDDYGLTGPVTIDFI